MSKYISPLSGDHLDLPPDLHGHCLVQISEIATGTVVEFQRLDKEPKTLRWYRWVQDPHGYPGAQDPREPPCGHWEPYSVAEGKYQAVLFG